MGDRAGTEQELWKKLGHLSSRNLCGFGGDQHFCCPASTVPCPVEVQKHQGVNRNCVHLLLQPGGVALPVSQHVVSAGPASHPGDILTSQKLLRGTLPWLPRKAFRTFPPSPAAGDRRKSAPHVTHVHTNLSPSTAATTVSWGGSPRSVAFTKPGSTFKNKVKTRFIF